MGEVYLARDTRLHRDVAVKVLPAASTEHADRVRRFEQEARAAATLSHPNVMTVFDVGIDAGVPYVVFELLEGETLGAVLRDGALPPRRATDLAVQIVLGLAAAHEKGIVHRDLKPDNVFVTGDGRAKILDFGLARLTEAPMVAAGVTQTAATPPTGPGYVLGTAGYMAPEQVRGEVADHRADIFAFGSVCYEMLAGQPAFGGDSPFERMTAILKHDPPPLPAGTVPASLDRIVHRCLEKPPAQRFQSARDVAFALEALAAGTPSAASAAPTAGPVGTVPTARGRWVRIAALAASAAVGTALGAFALRPSPPAPAAPVTFEARSFDRLPVTNARFMPDGKTIVYSATPTGSPPELFVFTPGAEAPRPVGVTNAHLLSVSSTGELAVVVSPRFLDQRLYSGTLARMSLGSSPRPVAEDVREADWSPDGASMAVVRDVGHLRDRLEYPAGTRLYEASGFLSNPRVSPDGARVAFVEHQQRWDDRGWVKVVDRAGTVTTLTGELYAVQGLAWARQGSALVFSGNTTASSMLQPMSVPADGAAPARAILGVPARFIVFDVAADGRWLAVREDLSVGVRAKVPGQAVERDLSWLGTTGAQSLSPDGAWLLMLDVGARGGPNYGVVLRKTDGTQTMRLGEGQPQGLSPDGKWAAATIATPAQLVLYPTGAGEPARLPIAPLQTIVSAAWFPDGTRLLVCGAEAAKAPRCYGVNRAGGAPAPLTPEGTLATLAPDGKTLLLRAADGSARLAAIDGGASRPVLGLTPGDRQVGWSGDGRAIYVQHDFRVPGVVERVTLATGARTIVQQVAPEGESSVTALYVMDWVDDGRWYAYYFTSLPSTLFEVRGAIQ
jgi:dipeptidyl aminopeptidase/acylaminoacyl peptidase